MPKIRATLSSRLNKFVAEHKGVFSTDGSVLFCLKCNVKVNGEKRFTVIQHLSTGKHKSAVVRTNSLEKNLTLISNATSKAPFLKDMCYAMISADIPFNKLNNQCFRKFLEKYTKQTIPDESALRKNYLSDVYDQTIVNIRNFISNHKIWISIDETTDVEGRCIANVIIGTLHSDNPGKTFLLTSEVSDKASHQMICKLFDNSLFLLWPDGLRRDDVFLFITDAAPYMVKAARSLDAFYTNMIHLTCLAHGLHRIAEEIRKHFPKVDNLISNGKKIFLKASSRVLFFKTELPNIPLPPQPIITRWDTWLEAAFYYSDNFQDFSRIINTFDKNEAVSIQITQSLINDPNLVSNLDYIKSHFKFLPNSIILLGKKDTTLNESIDLMKNVENYISKIPGNVGKAVQEKFHAFIKKNKGYDTLKKISACINGTNGTLEKIEQNFSPIDVSVFKYAPVTSVDVERRFSRFKKVLAENRRNFTLEDLKKTFVVQCNANAFD